MRINKFWNETNETNFVNQYIKKNNLTLNNGNKNNYNQLGEILSWVYALLDEFKEN